MGASSAQPSDIMRGICLDLAGNRRLMLQNHVGPHDSTDQGLTIVPSQPTHIRPFLTTPESLPHFTVPTAFSFTSISFPLGSLWHRESLSVWGHLRNGLRSAMPCLCIMVPGRGHLGHDSSLPHSRPLVILAQPALVVPCEGHL